MSEIYTAIIECEELLREHYDIGEVAGLEALQRMDGAYGIPMLLQVENNKYLIQKYPKDKAIINNVEFRHRLTKHLQSNNIPVPNILKTKNGERLLETEDSYIEVQEHLEGGNMELTPEHLIGAGDMLGWYHKACESFKEEYQAEKIWQFAEPKADAFKQVSQWAFNESDDANLKKAIKHIKAFMLEAPLEFDDSRQKVLETGIIHGNWKGLYLVFDGDHLNHINNISFARSGCYLEDLASAVTNHCLRTTRNPEKLSERTDMFMQQYQLIRPLSYPERIALYYAVGLKQLSVVTFQLLLFKGKLAGLSSAQWIHRMAEQIHWLEKQAKAERWGKKK